MDSESNHNPGPPAGGNLPNPALVVPPAEVLIFPPPAAENEGENPPTPPGAVAPEIVPNVNVLPPLKRVTGRVRSMFWRDVVLLEDDDDRRSADDNSPTHICKLCNKIMFCGWIAGRNGSGKGCYNTTPAQNHLTKHCTAGKVKYLPKITTMLVREKEEKRVRIEKRKGILGYHTPLAPGQLQLSGKASWCEEAISTQGNFIVYSKTCMPLSIIHCPHFQEMLTKQVSRSFTGQVPLLSRLSLDRFIDEEYEVMKENIQELFAAVVKDSKLNRFMQLFHDGVTLDNQMKCQAVACQLVHPKWEQNVVLALGFCKVNDSVGETVTDLAQKVVLEMTGFPLSVVCGHGKQDRAALRVAALLGFEKEACDMHDGDKIGRAALGDLVRRDGRGGKCHHFQIGLLR